ncbi:hypothetical protein E2C01_000102 [Portunus trituberculatus]|uniref:Uncharacterized protein n=1 Tax=Portunus trituberculatus TaxID=210409 RepID=A0A5B7CE98_PORTR|nr:hypothetical protein [Portunus trituberculatus]
MVTRSCEEVIEQSTHHLQPQVFEGKCGTMEQLHYVQSTLQFLNPHYLWDSKPTQTVLDEPCALAAARRAFIAAFTASSSSSGGLRVTTSFSWKGAPHRWQVSVGTSLRARSERTHPQVHTKEKR